MKNEESHLIEEGFPIEKYWKIFKPKIHIIIFIALAAVLFTFIRISLKPDIFQSNGLLMIEPESVSAMTAINPRRFFADFRNEYFNTQIKILKSRSLNKTVMRALYSTFNPRKKKNPHHDFYISGAMIEPIEFTRLVRVSCQSSDPQMAAKLINTLFEKFIEFNLDVKTQSSKQASDYISKQITELQKNLANKEEELQAYGKRKELFYLSRNESTVVDKFSDLNKAYTQAQINRINNQAIYEELKNLKFEDYPQVKQDSVVNSLKTTYSSLESEYIKKSQIFKESYPQMNQLKSQMENLQQRIKKESQEIAIKNLKEARSNYQSSLKKENSLLALLNKQKKTMISSNADAIYYNSLGIEVKNMRNLLDYLVKKQKESLLSSRLEGIQTSNIKVIDRAEVARYPIPKGMKRNIMIALFIGLAIGLGLIFFIDFLDRSIKSTEDIKPLLGVPVLGIIPSSKVKSKSSGYYLYNYSYGENKKGKNPDKVKHIEMINFSDPESPYSENYRTIRTSILLSTPKHPPKIITVSSAVPSEGKTSTIVNLAISFCQLNKRVLIMDGDLRKPRIHKIFNIKNNSGLSSYLVGRTKLADLIQKSHIPNLYVIPSGPIPPNPSELIETELMTDLLAKLKEKVDFIFIDTPPFVGIVDPILLGKNSDGLIIVIWAGKTHRNSILKFKEEIDRFNIRTLGVVLNRVDYKKEGYGYYSYHQYYSHYKESEEEKDRFKTGFRKVK